MNNNICRETETPVSVYWFVWFHIDVSWIVERLFKCAKEASRSGPEGGRKTNLFTPEGKLSLLLMCYFPHTSQKWAGAEEFEVLMVFFFLLNTSESNEDEWKSNRAFWLLHLIEIASVQIQQSDARCQRWHPRLHNILKVWNKFWLFLLMLTESLAPQRSPLLLEHLYERLHLQFQGFLNWRQTTFYFNLSFRLSVRYPVCRWAQGRSKSVTVGASDIMTSFIHSNGRDILYLLSATTNGERFVRQPTANLNTNILQVKADPATEVSNSDEVKRERNSPRTP